MKFFLDSALVDEIAHALKMWHIDGVTTNPRHVSVAGKPFLTTIHEIWRILTPGGLAIVSVAGRIHDDTDYQEVEPGTYLPTTGSEAGLPHHIFNEQTLAQAFSKFHIDFIDRRDSGRVLMIQAHRR